MRFRAPATTANLGPGFDCAGAALDLWNELEVVDGERGEISVAIEGLGANELPAGPEHLGLRAFALLAPVEGRRFRFVNRVPLARGLGSSAATIALGLVAGAAAAAREPTPEDLLALALQLENHADNLAAAFAGGVTLTWGGRIARIATTTPLLPIAVVPRNRVETEAARRALAPQVSHADAAYTAGRAAILGAALAAGDAALLAQAFDDRLHEPYRGAFTPAFADLRERPPAGGAGVTISGSGPTVIVWADPPQAGACIAELQARFADAEILALPVTPEGAGLTP
jgi:homoserine kinase